jgi:hypothetical protein
MNGMHPAEPAMASPTEHLSAMERDLLQILCCVAWADGEFGSEEKQLLERLVRRCFLEADQGAAVEEFEAMAAREMGLDVLDRAAARLESDEDRLLALKLAYMIIRVDRRTGDTSTINREEKVAYRRLVQGLRLSETEIQEAEWAAERELEGHSGLLSVLSSRFRSLGLGA